MRCSASVAKTGPVGARASGLKSVSGPSMDSCRYSILLVRPGTVPWIHGPPLLALPLVLVVSSRLDGTWGSSYQALAKSSYQARAAPKCWERERCLVLSGDSRPWMLLLREDPAPGCSCSWVLWILATSTLVTSRSRSRRGPPCAGVVASRGGSPGGLVVVLSAPRDSGSSAGWPPGPPLVGGGRRAHCCGLPLVEPSAPGGSGSCTPPLL